MPYDIRHSTLVRALDEAWANPHLDRAVSFKLTRLTPDNGIVSRLILPYLSLNLPDTSTRYHIYRLGAISKDLYGIEQALPAWTKLSDIANTEDLLIQLHTNHHQFCISQCFAISDNMGMINIAVPMGIHTKLLSFSESVVLRFYSNQWYRTAEGRLTEGINIHGTVVSDRDSILAFLAELDVWRAKTGYAWLFHNGQYKSELRADEPAVGDTLEFHYDASVKGYIDKRLSDLSFFTSELDEVQKYLVTNENDPDNVNDYEYSDDTDFYTCSTEATPSGDARDAGVLFDRFNPSDIRMVTHRDWSIDANRFNNIYSSAPRNLSLANGFVRIFMRHSIKSNDLPLDYNYLRDFYLLSEEDRISVMVGKMSTFSRWSAIELEKSAYLYFMQLARSKMTGDSIIGVYNWYGVNNIMVKAHKRPTGWDLPPISPYGCIALHFKEGLLIKVHSLTETERNSSIYQITDGADTIQYLPGELVSPDELSVSVSRDGYTLDPVIHETLFSKRTGEGKYIRAILGTDYELNSDKTVQWLPVRDGAVIRKASAIKYCYGKRTFTPRTIMEPIDIFEGNVPELGHVVGTLSLYLNGRWLTPNVDYVFNYPDVQIFNRGFYSGKDDIVMEYTFGGSDPVKPVPDFGHVKHRYLSHNGKFDLSLYRGKHTFVDGKLIQPELLGWDEARRKESDVSVKEGALYGISEPTQILADIEIEQLTDSREKSVEIDSEIEALLTILIPTDNIGDAILSPTKHHVVSVLMHRLIDQMSTGQFIVKENTWSDLALDLILDGYEYEVESDKVILGLDKNFIQIHAFPESGDHVVSSNQYSLLTRINEAVYGGRIQLSDYLVIS